MSGYIPINIDKFTTGLVQERPEFTLPEDGFPVLENLYVYRGKVIRKKGTQFLGRLRRIIEAVSAGSYDTTAGTNTFSIFTLLGVAASEPNASIELGDITNISITVDATGQVLTNTNGTTTLTVTGAGQITSASINYATGVVSVTATSATGAPSTITIDTLAYYPRLPVMGIRGRELNTINREQTIIFDTKYAYRYVGTGYEEFISGTTWTGSDSDFFWSTNYWNDASNNKLFWVTNTLSSSGDVMRYSNGTTWTTFQPAIDGTNYLTQALILLPFRSRLIAFNTMEGTSLGASINYYQRIRWAQIGSPIAADSWRDDSFGKGGYLDIPTSQSITCVGFVRDNLVIFCERSTWQLRYTGNQVAPFSIEKVNTELGAESTFSAVPFDTSLVGVGDKGIVECDSFKSQRIDEKIIDQVYRISNTENGVKRVHGYRDIPKKIAYWTYPDSVEDKTYPDRRLVYNYENQSWAIFKDHITCIGTYQPASGLTWAQCKFTWSSARFTWRSQTEYKPEIIGGNHQGFVFYLDKLTYNQQSLQIDDITGNITTATTITSEDHNLSTGDIIFIENILAADPFTSLNDVTYGVQVLDADSFRIFSYNSLEDEFSTPVLNASGTYLGGGTITIKDNFRLLTKKFSLIEKGQKIRIGYIDMLLAASSAGSISMQVLIDYQNDPAVNRSGDTFFNNTISTSKPNLRPVLNNQFYHRVFCAAWGSFVQFLFTLSPSQMNDISQSSVFELSSLIPYVRPGGRLFL